MFLTSGSKFHKLMIILCGDGLSFVALIITWFYELLSCFQTNRHLFLNEFRVDQCQACLVSPANPFSTFAAFPSVTIACGSFSAGSCLYWACTHICVHATLVEDRCQPRRIKTWQWAVEGSGVCWQCIGEMVAIMGYNRSD